jgi:hypothetical protein
LRVWFNGKIPPCQGEYAGSIFAWIANGYKCINIFGKINNIILSFQFLNKLNWHDTECEYKEELGPRMMDIVMVFLFLFNVPIHCVHPKTMGPLKSSKFYCYCNNCSQHCYSVVVWILATKIVFARISKPITIII